MENNNKILEELSQFCPSLAGFKNNNPYSVSSSYFDGIAETVVEKIRSGAEGGYYFTDQNPYTVPANYFDDFLASIVQKISKKSKQAEIEQEIENIAPLLNTISKKPIYTTPDGYFNEVQWSNSGKTSKKGRLATFSGGRKIYRHAAAAAVIGVLAMSIFLFTGKQYKTTKADSAKAFIEVKKLSEKEIIDFLKSSAVGGSMVTNNSNNNSKKKESDIKSIVSEMSDKEIQRFLEENGEQDEM